MALRNKRRMDGRRRRKPRAHVAMLPAHGILSRASGTAEASRRSDGRTERRREQMTAKTDDRQKRIREQEDIIRRALTNDKITYAEERAIIEPAHKTLDELEGEPELEELNLTKPKGSTPLQRATEAIRNASHDKFDAALRAYLRELTEEAIAAGVPLTPDVRSALLAFQASQHSEPLKQKRRLDRSNRLYYEVFCDEEFCKEKHKHKFYSDILRARPDAKRK